MRKPGVTQAPKPPRAATTAMAEDERNALRTLDLVTVERLLQAGWDPNAAMDHDRNTALDYLLGDCEWDRGHDRHEMVLVARTLLGRARASTSGMSSATRPTALPRRSDIAVLIIR